MNKVKMLKIVSCFFLALGMVPAALAQEEEAPVTLDLEQYVACVLKYGPDMKLYAKDLDEAGAVKKEAWATALPKVALSAGYSRNLKENFM